VIPASRSVKRDIKDWKPREYRRRVSVPGSAQRTDGTVFPVLVTNMSYHGCELEADRPLRRAETLTLMLPNMGRLPAQIRWETGGKAGLRFLIGHSKDARRARIGV
jgi:hypothetical protein